MHTETGPGVYEAAIRFSNALEMADRSSLFKLAIKQLAKKFELMASFMAKWSPIIRDAVGTCIKVYGI